ncbi:MAG TPA: biotin carboxylase N-terminal domain-containing protein [Allosphingosinicella sp.]|nr:biotin carboxylase N-terminal domain-containing protein [Allosphingosinicella sp.]
MIRRLFIANRGEIALRVIRTARRLGLTTILAVSSADGESLPARLADETAPVDTYLDIGAMIAAAVAARADAIHPGYGFLSENAAFARAAVAAGIGFVGPDPATLDAMGDKLNARRIASAAGLPTVPGREGGYPLLIKAVAGGGGRGMKRVDREEEFAAAEALARSEALAAFGNSDVYVEKFIASGRHVEVQVLGDGSRAVHLGDRDCSIQRRFQKLVEEAPAPLIPDDKRDALRTAAVRLAEHLNYRGAGTVEFLVDADTFDFYFLEMNARIQVEHPVTEAVTGIDLVEQQLQLADGQPLSLTQDMIALDGHAIEVRINAEDPAADFRPSPGRVTRAAWPAGPGIRVDSHIADGGKVPPLYDSLIGKLIVSGADRAEAVARLGAALAALEIDGVASTAPLHRRIAADPRFVAGGVDTRFFEGFSHG